MLGWTQREIADRFGCDRSLVSKDLVKFTDSGIFHTGHAPEEIARRTGLQLPVVYAKQLEDADDAERFARLVRAYFSESPRSAPLTRSRSCQKLGPIADTAASFRDAVIAAVDSGALGRMSSSQRAIFAAQFVTTTHGGARHRGVGFVPLRSALPYRTICDALGVGSKTLGRAVKVHRSGRDDIASAVRDGRLMLAEAVRELT